MLPDDQDLHLKSYIEHEDMPDKEFGSEQFNDDIPEVRCEEILPSAGMGKSNLKFLANQYAVFQ